MGPRKRKGSGILLPLPELWKDRIRRRRDYRKREFLSTIHAGGSLIMRLQNRSTKKIVEYDFSETYTPTGFLLGWYTWEGNNDYLWDDIALFYPEFAWKEIPNE